MADDLYTDGLTPEDPTSLSQHIRSALAELQMSFSGQKIKPLHWNKHYVAVPIEVDVELPTRGPVGSVDVRPREPIILLLHREYYPYKTPIVYSDRRDFPRGRLPHLNPTRPGAPANFCLHRGKIDSWFAEHGIIDLVARARGWLRDAARDRLIRKEDGFEPTRFQDAVIGYAIYEPMKVLDYVHERWQNTDYGPGFGFLWYELLKNSAREPLVGDAPYAIRLIYPLPYEGLNRWLEISCRFNELSSEERDVGRYLFGILAWPAQNNQCSTYFGELPCTLSELEKWGESLGISVRAALDLYQSQSLQLLGDVPITLVIPRPQRILGSESNLELISFVIHAAGEFLPKEGKWVAGSPVNRLGHRQPLTQHMARYISAQPTDASLGRVMFLGCGAVGSKMVLHLARSGFADITLVDNDEVSPHNMVRHGLLSDSLGQNKAEAMKKAIEGIFYGDSTVKVDAVDGQALDILGGEKKHILEKHSWIIDATASPMVLNIISQALLPETLLCCRCEIADNGHLGLLGIEGPNRNPRLDDMQALLFDLAVENRSLSRWLRSNREQRETTVGSVLEDINIGVSCSSETMRLSDDIVSLHAASFATGFRKGVEACRNKFGRIQIGLYDEYGSLSTVIEHFDFQPMTVLAACNDNSWQVRLKNGVQQRLELLLEKASPNETGGLLIGMVNFKRRIIYVTRVLIAPPDSLSSPYAFVRGVQDIPREVLDIEELTGGMIGYVGEWHTHPRGGSNLSKQDRNTIDRLRATLDTVPLPTHVMIVTKRGIHPYVFAPV